MAVDAELVIFDCDGVLVDSEPIVNAVFRDMLEELGLHLNLAQMYERFMGLPMSACMEQVRRQLGRTPPETFLADFSRRCEAALRSQLQPVPGIRQVLDGLPVPCCVASSGEHSKMRLTLGLTGLLQYFEGRIFSVTEVPRGKPHPDVFLHAARSLGADPGRTVVIEDSIMGVTAGVAAGMTVFGYAALVPAARLARAGAHPFASMTELPGLLGLGS